MERQVIIKLNENDCKTLEKASNILRMIDSRLWSVDDIEKISHGKELDTKLFVTLLYELDEK